MVLRGRGLCDGRFVSFRFVSSANIISNPHKKLDWQNSFDFTFLPSRLSRCPPCKAIKPVYESLSDEYEGIGFGKIDIDDNQDAAVEYQISSVPTFVFFDGKEKYGQFSGADQNQLEAVLKDLDQV